MPTPVRPSDNLDWGGTQVQPTAPQKATGFVPNFRPPAEWHNWMFGIVDAWIKWLDYLTQSLVATVLGSFDAVVGVGGTHATINDLMADPNVANYTRVLVTSPQTLIATQVINKDDIEFVFKPSAVYSKGLTTTPGISITANRVTIRGGRFTDFSGGSDVAISLSGTSKNCYLDGCRFANCTTAIADAGGNNAFPVVIEEV